MIEWLQRMLVRTFYIRLDARAIRIDSPGLAQGFIMPAAIALRGEGRGATVVAIGEEAERMRGSSEARVIYPFAHPRVIVDDFNVAEKLLTGALRKLFSSQPWTFVRPMVRVIVQPLRKLDGGLTKVERRVLLELMENCGARKIAIHEGPELRADALESFEPTAFEGR
jgi:rod shape-determining protein MreB